MTVPCTSCGEILDPADHRCPHCGTLAAPRPGTSVFAHESTEPRWADGPAGEPTVVGDPLSIPIREPEPPVGRDDPDGGVPRPVVVALAAVAAVALVAVLAAQLLGSDEGDDVASDGVTPSTEPGAGDAVAAGATSSTTADTSTTTSASTTTTSSTSTTSTPTSTTTSTTTTTAPPTSDPGSVPTLPASYRGGWVAQLSSVPASSGTQSIEAAYARIRADVPGAVAARSDEWPSMAPGYWVFVETGFASKDAVHSFCSTVGRSGDACLPRELANRR